jgi:hypothetical protein
MMSVTRRPVDSSASRIRRTAGARHGQRGNDGFTVRGIFHQPDRAPQMKLWGAYVKAL